MTSESKRTMIMTNSNYIEGDSTGSIQAQHVNLGSFQSSTTPISLTDVDSLIAELEALINKSVDIPPQDKRKLKEDLGSARSSVTDPKPDTKRALSRIESAIEILKHTAAIAASGATLLPLAEKVAMWLQTLIK